VIDPSVPRGGSSEQATTSIANVPAPRTAMLVK